MICDWFIYDGDELSLLYLSIIQMICNEHRHDYTGLSLVMILEQELAMVESVKDLLRVHEEMLQFIDSMKGKISKTEASRSANRFELAAEQRKVLEGRQVRDLLQLGSVVAAMYVALIPRMDADYQLFPLCCITTCRLEWVGGLLQGLPLLHGTAHGAAKGSLFPSVLRSARCIPTHDCLLATASMCAVLQGLEVY